MSIYQALEKVGGVAEDGGLVGIGEGGGLQAVEPLGEERDDQHAARDADPAAQLKAGDPKPGFGLEQVHPRTRQLQHQLERVSLDRRPAHHARPGGGEAFLGGCPPIRGNCTLTMAARPPSGKAPER